MMEIEMQISESQATLYLVHGALLGRYRSFEAADQMAAISRNQNP
jgi:hypothetical protein